MRKTVGDCLQVKVSGSIRIAEHKNSRRTDSGSAAVLSLLFAHTDNIMGLFIKPLFQSALCFIFIYILSNFFMKYFSNQFPYCTHKLIMISLIILSLCYFSIFFYRNLRSTSRTFQGIKSR